MEMNINTLLNKTTLLWSLTPQVKVIHSDITNLRLKVLETKVNTNKQNIALIMPQGLNIRQSSITKIIGCFFVVMIHVLVVYSMMHHQDDLVIRQPSIPMVVSMIATPAIEPLNEKKVEPVVKSSHLKKVSVTKPNRVVKKMVASESVNEPVTEEIAKSADEILAPVNGEPPPVVVAAEGTKSSTLEEQIELPKFGVAYLNNPAPDYPKLAKRLGEEGRVLLKVLVSVDGKAERVNLDKSSGYERLDQAAIDAVKQWRFVPARKGGQALSAYVLVPIKFSLDG